MIKTKDELQDKTDRCGQLEQTLGDKIIECDQLQDKVAEKVEELGAERAENQRRNYLLLAGDWTMGFQSCMKKYEGTAKQEWKDRRRHELLAEGVKPKAVTEQIEEESGWNCITGHTAGELYSEIQGEKTAVQKWRAQGGVAASAPKTPFLDRFNIACSLVGSDLSSGEELIRILAERNEIAHGGVDIKDYVNDLKQADWMAIKTRTEEEIARVQAKVTKGQITQDQCDTIIRCIKAWLRGQVHEFDQGSVVQFVETDAGKIRVKEAFDHNKQQKKKTCVKGSLNYFPGKWDNCIPE